MTDILQKNLDPDTDTGRTPGEWTQRADSHPEPRSTQGYQKLGEMTGTHPPQRLQTMHGTANTLISDFWHPEL